MFPQQSMLDSFLNLCTQGRRRPILVVIVVSLIICITLLRRLNPYELQSPYDGREQSFVWKGNASLDWDYRRDAKRLLFNAQECERTFPGLFYEVNRMVESRRKKHVTLRELDSIELRNGNIRAMLYDQEVHVLSSSPIPLAANHLYSFTSLPRRAASILAASPFYTPYTALLSRPRSLYQMSSLLSVQMISFLHYPSGPLLGSPPMR